MWAWKIKTLTFLFYAKKVNIILFKIPCLLFSKRCGKEKRSFTWASFKHKPSFPYGAPFYSVTFVKVTFQHEWNLGGINLIFL